MPNPFNPVSLFVNPGSQAARYNATHPGTPEIALLASIPQAIWLTSTDSAADTVQRAMSVLPATDTPIFVVYNIPGRDNNGASTGGALGTAEYEQFIDTLESLTAPVAPIFILEPDALPFLPQLAEDQAQQRFDCLGYAIDQLSHAGTVYLDAGHPAWLPAAHIADLYNDIGATANQGFSLNVSNFRTTAECQAYAQQLYAATRKPSVIDTSRNGNGPPADVNDIQNPLGRKIGTRPLEVPFSKSVDANLWIKAPGESDGPAHGGGFAGTFNPQFAIHLVRG